MARVAFTLPFTDGDITGATDIIFSVGGGGNLTATVALPQAGAPGLTYGYYNYKTAGSGVADSLAQAVADALTAADAETWTVQEVSGGLPGRVQFLRGGTPATVSIKWGDASTTFDPAWLGFQATTYTAISTSTATWPAGRMFLPPRSMWTVGMPKRTTLVSESYSGRKEKRTLSQGFKRYKFKTSLLSPPRCLLDFAADADWYISVPDMVQSDPNTPFEALWRWMDRRAPLRYHADRDTDGTYLELDVGDSEALSQLVGRWLDDPHELGSNPLQTVSFEATEYVS